MTDICVNCGEVIEEVEEIRMDDEPPAWVHRRNQDHTCRMMPRTPGGWIYFAFPGGDGLTRGIRDALGRRSPEPL